ncbi:MAG: hypothetical protein KatS3mg050_2739 [Litorilinea sp.]|nr:MAG: hypothetical protein KatS3mg050_2739 [Litorilinea sp.]
MGNPHQPVENMRAAFQMLNQRWEEARSLWNDPVRWRFERTYWEPLERQARASQEEAARLADLLATVMRQAL